MSLLLTLLAPTFAASGVPGFTDREDEDEINDQGLRLDRVF